MSRVVDERGQSTVEWVGLVLVVSLLAAALAGLAGMAVPGIALAESIGSRIVCAVGLGGSCGGGGSELAVAYGAEVAALAGEHAPTIRYEDGMLDLPIDYRDCRSDDCALGPPDGAVSRTFSGLPAAAFVHVVDCRADPAATLDAGADCSGERAGNLYLQYWLYYPDSKTDPWGPAGYHHDDWESFQVRIGAETDARASSHHSYNYEGGVRNWGSDAGIWSQSGWGPFTGSLYVSGGSHAGHVADDDDSDRYTPAPDLLLIPIEPIAEGAGDVDFAVSPPWEKEVYRDPESEGT
ncbi:MAG: hypothetical protein GEU88_03040 [Solirubrobacterales bacterium]|nr:hypothetical protein [Solirubrobacterales bacterium]